MTFAVRVGGQGAVRLVGAVIVLAGLASCGSSGGGKCTTNCGTDAAVDAPVDHGKDMMSVEKQDARSDAPADMRSSVDRANACDQSITAACSATHDGGTFTVHCAASWGATTASAYFCGRPQTTVLIRTCGDYQELLDTNGSSEYDYVYDAAGALYAIIYTSGGASHCVAGPATLTDLSCSAQPTLFSCAADAGRHG
jgi:hypothetical protein